MKLYSWYGHNTNGDSEIIVVVIGRVRVWLDIYVSTGSNKCTTFLKIAATTVAGLKIYYSSSCLGFITFVGGLRVSTLKHTKSQHFCASIFLWLQFFLKCLASFEDKCNQNLILQQIRTFKMNQVDSLLGLWRFTIRILQLNKLTWCCEIIVKWFCAAFSTGSFHSRDSKALLALFPERGMLCSQWWLKIEHCIFICILFSQYRSHTFFFSFGSKNEINETPSRWKKKLMKFV